MAEVRMPVWLTVLAVVLGLMLLVLLYGIGLVARRRAISRHGGTFELSLRRDGAPEERGWSLGLGRYSGDRLEYFRIFSLSHRPKRAWHRFELRYEGPREPTPVEAAALYFGHVIVDCRVGNDEFQVAMSRESLMGLQSWLEARPPGADWNTPRML